MGTKFPRNESSSERTGQGAKGPRSERARVLLANSLLGANAMEAKRLGTISEIL